MKQGSRPIPCHYFTSSLASFLNKEENKLKLFVETFPCVAISQLFSMGLLSITEIFSYKCAYKLKVMIYVFVIINADYVFIDCICPYSI